MFSRAGRLMCFRELRGQQYWYCGGDGGGEDVESLQRLARALQRRAIAAMDLAQSTSLHRLDGGLDKDLVLRVHGV
jgi:hypothetical protein